MIQPSTGRQTVVVRLVDFNLDELKQLDAGYYFEKNGKHPYRNQGIQLVTIEELFQRFPDMQVHIGN